MPSLTILTTWRTLRSSLRRLDNGTYGACSSCGADIGEDRLKAMPFVDTCVKCKARTEGPKKHSL